jgi:hypothetical protein
MIYFVQTPSGSVKIGCTEDIETRLARLESHYGQPVALLATMPGDRAVEREIHGRFAHLRLRRTEQFQPAVELMEFIGKPLLVMANPESVAVTEPRGEVVLIVMDPKDIERLERVAQRRGLSRASFARMAVLALIDQEEMKGGSR